MIVERAQLAVETGWSPQGLSAAQDRFLEFVSRNPEALERSRFAPVLQHDEFLHYDPQPWPVFLDEAKREELARASTAISRLVRSLPERMFANDPARLARHFEVNATLMQLVVALMQSTDILAAAFGRGDFVETVDGLRCLELNLSSYLGGWEAKVWRERYLTVPLIQQFLEESGTRLSSVDSLQLMFEHLLSCCRHLAAGGEVNVALAQPGSVLPPQRLTSYLAAEWEQVLARSNTAGSLSVGRMSDFVEERGSLVLNGRRIHGVIELGQGEIPAPLFRAAMLGSARIYNGPVGRLLSNKLVLALLSESAGSDLFSAEERRQIEEHVPWTRRVAPGITSWRGERIALPDLLISEQENLVLKPADGLGGEGVLLGNRAEPALWREAVQKALASRNWLAQELLVPKPYLFQAGEVGCAPHDLVWGLYTLGDRYAGCYVRMLRSDSSQGVVNAAQGASPAVTIDVSGEEPGGRWPMP